MGNLLAMITENPLGSTLAAAVIVGLLGWLLRSFRDWRDSDKIYRFLKSSTERFRSTHAIAASIRLSEDRVAALCAKHSRIHRNGLEKQSWRLAD